jgi:transposase
LPERAPGALVADKAYDYDPIRDDLKQRGIRAVIPPKSNRTKTICYNKRLYRQRNCIDRVPKPAAELRTCADAPRSLHAIWRDSSAHL